MISKLPRILCATILMAAATTAARADRPWLQWSPEDGAMLRQGHHVEWYRGGEGRYSGNLSGEAAFVWSDCRNGDRGVYLQVIDIQGNLKFAVGGVPVSDASNRQEDPQTWPSEDGGWFVGWEDFDADSLGDIYCNKISADGRRLWNANGERGIAVCAYQGIQEDIRIVSDGDGGCILAWSDQRGGDISDLYAQHVLADGRIDPNWPEDGLPIVSAQGAQASHTADADGLGGMIIGWKDGRRVGNSDIWAQRINPRGQLLWGDGQGIRVCAHAANQESPKLCPDGAGGAFFSWVDDRNLQESDKDIYAQRVNRDGQLLWPADGESVCTVAREQTENRIVNSYAGEAVVMWEDKRADGLTYDVYAMRISGANRMSKGWDPPTGAQVFVAVRNQQQARLYPDGQGGAYFCNEDERERGFPEVDIWAQHLNRNGQPTWQFEGQSNGIPVCRANGNQNSPLIRRTAGDGCVITWGDYRTGSQEIWAQRLRPDGEIVWEVNGRPLVQGLGGNAISPKVTYHGDGSFTVLWLDGRFGGNGTVPFLATVRDGGDHPDILFTPNGIPVFDSTRGGGINPDAAPSDAGRTIAVWEDHRVGDIYAIYAQKLAADGSHLWGARGHKVADYHLEQTLPRVCSDGQGGAYVAWRAANDRGNNDVFMQRLSGDGERLWGDDGITVASNDSADEQVEELIPDGNGGAVITWQVSVIDPETRQWDDNIRATRFTSNQERLWGAQGNDGIPIVRMEGRQRTSRIVRHQAGYMMVWVDGREDHGDGQPGNDIYGQFILPDGRLVWRDNGLLIVNADQHQDNPALAIDNLGYVWCAWEDHRGTGTALQRDVYLQKFYPRRDGQALQMRFGAEGMAVSATNYNQIKPAIIGDGQNGVWLAWEDYRASGVWSDIYATHLDPRGNRYQGWIAHGNIVTSAFHKQEVAQLVNLTPRGESGAAIVWEDKRATGKEELSNVYIQLLDAAPLSVSGPGGQAPMPHGFEIVSVHPNPFNAKAIVSFTLTTAGTFRLTLFDIAGREVRQIAQNEWSAGTHRVVLDGDRLAAGSYVVRLEGVGSSVEQLIKLIK